MILPDINLLLYAYDSLAAEHRAAVRWWSATLSGDEPVGLAVPVALGFVRLATHARVFRQPLALAEATAAVRSWMERPQVEVLIHSARHLQQVLNLLAAAGTAGNLVGDAQLAALALEHDATVFTADADFIRFPGLRWRNPLVKN